MHNSVRRRWLGHHQGRAQQPVGTHRSAQVTARDVGERQQFLQLLRFKLDLQFFVCLLQPVSDGYPAITVRVQIGQFPDQKRTEITWRDLAYPGDPIKKAFK